MAIHKRWNTTLFRCATLVAPLLALLSVSETGVAADSAAGERLARRMCADCHLIDRVQRRGMSDAPSFVEIARIPNMSAERIVLMVLAPHPPMPELPLTTRQAEDLDAYIRSLAE